MYHTSPHTCCHSLPEMEIILDLRCCYLGEDVCALPQVRLSASGALRELWVLDPREGLWVSS